MDMPTSVNWRVCKVNREMFSGRCIALQICLLTVKLFSYRLSKCGSVSACNFVDTGLKKYLLFTTSACM